ncbi:MAG: anti-sigma factor [Candidatus Dormiibacterota bacterium]
MGDETTRHEMEYEVAAYVLDALEPGEEAAVEAHLASCASCREIERRLRGVTSALPLSAPEATPPPRLRERVLAIAGASPATPAAPARPLTLPSPGRRDRRGWPQPLQVALAAGVAALLALGGWNVYLAQQLHQAQSQAAAGSVSQHPIAATAAKTMTGAGGQVVQLHGEGLAIVSLSRLPPLAQGQVYELWVGPNAKQVQPAGVFLPEPDGSKVLLLSRDLTHDSLVAVTVEPGPNGSSAPTQAPGLVGQL